MGREPLGHWQALVQKVNDALQLLYDMSLGTNYGR